MLHSYRAPQTDDGWVVDVSHDRRGELLIQVEFRIPRDLDEATIVRHARFASRSRIARLGIDIQPTSAMDVQGDRATMTASVRAVVPQYGIEKVLPQVIVPQLRVGRLVVCAPEYRRTSEQIYEEYSHNAFKLPRGFSIDAEGRFTIRPHKLVYELEAPPSVDQLQAILERPDGKSLLNRLQIARPVDNILLQPGQGVITSCTMFLHRHFAVLESEQSPLGRHMHAVVLDPITTRGPRVFLEFFNDSTTPIVNPTATGFIYAAQRVPTKLSAWEGSINGTTHIEADVAQSQYHRLSGLFESAPTADRPRSYLDRPVAVIRQPLATVRRDEPLDWFVPQPRDPNQVFNRSTQHRVITGESAIESFGTRVLDELAEGSRATVLMQHFPNLAEHMDLMTAAVQRKISRLIFQRASFEHGPFLSSRDHGRLADYADLDVEVLWCNELRRHLAVLVFRGHRGFFCELKAVDSFKNALVVAVYGSSGELQPDEAARLEGLIESLYTFFGEELAIMTGGGPGAMQQASKFAHERNLLVGASYLEIEDQQTNQLADFYQVFQENCRHSRQRWFEIAGFHIFCIGGVGTLEEIGITLTDIKLGLAEGTPLVFFGRYRDQLYWSDLVQQLGKIAEAGRGPQWLRTHLLVTADPEEVIAFYKTKLDLG